MEMFHFHIQVLWILYNNGFGNDFFGDFLNFPA